MKKTLLETLPDGLPSDIRRFTDGAAVYDSSSSPNATVYYLDKGSGFYLKRADKGQLKKEAAMTAYFHAKGLGTEVLQYVSDDFDWLLTAAVVGNDCTHEDYLSHPERLCDTLAEELRRLHETDCSDCPIPNRMADYLAAAEENFRTGNYDQTNFPDSFGYCSAEEAHAVLTAEKDALQSKVLLHGDYCLPNIILDNWKLSGFIDVGNGGVGDRHIDLFWGVWSLWFNLKTDRYGKRFLDAYGRDKADESILRIVAAAEVFG